MAEPHPRSSFARRVAAARPRPTEYAVWDDKIPGLGVRIYPSGARSYFLRRLLPDGRLRSVTLGSVGQMRLPEARREARRTLATLLAAPARGQGPRRPGRPMDAFAEEFLERHARYWKPATLASNTRLLRTVKGADRPRVALDVNGPGQLWRADAAPALPALHCERRGARRYPSVWPPDEHVRLSDWTLPQWRQP